MLYSILFYALCKLYLILNIYQQAHYQFKLYVKHFLINILFYDLFPFVVLLLGILHQEFIVVLICSIYLGIFGLFYFICRVRLKFTKRIVRGLILCLPFLGIAWIPYVGFYLLLFLEFLILPVLLLERCISKLLNVPYLTKAKKELTRYKGNVIAVTGSFGKTSTKGLLQQALSLYAPTIATPKSYNTELGISRFVNERSDLNIYDHMILEFGASHKGDIGRLKNLKSPDVAFVTGIGYMHVETFGCLDTIIAEKMSILEGTRVAVLNYECPYIRSYPISFTIHKITYGFHYGTYQARNIKGQEFDLFKEDNRLGHFKTNLVGTHQLLNLTGVLAYMADCGYDLNRLMRASLSFHTEKNRLELKKMGSYYVLDDSFNSNYEGFLEALNRLRFHSGKRVLLTPGMVELGKYKKELFSNLVEYIVASADIVILTGYYQTISLYKKLKGFNKEVYLVRNFMEGYHLFLTLTEIYEGSMLLIENDVPDLYRVGLI